MQYVKVFFAFVYPFVNLQLLLLVFIVINTAISLAPPYALKILIDESIPNKDLNQLYQIGFILLLVYFVRAGINYFNSYYSTIVYNKIGDDIRKTLFNNLIHQPYRYFEKNTQGDIIQTINSEVGKVQSFLANGMVGFINNLFVVIGISVMLAVTDKVLFLLYLSLFPLPFVVNLFYNKKIKKLIKESAILEGRLFNFYIDKIKNVALIKSYRAISVEIKRLEAQLTLLLSNRKSRSMYSSLSSNFSGFFVSIGPLLLLMIGGYQAVIGTLTIGSVVAFIQYSNRLTPPLNGILGIHLEYSRVLVSMKRIFPLLLKGGKDLKNSVRSLPTFKEITTIDVHKLSFFHGEKHVLRDLSFNFQKGVSYAIVGENGAGKSTFLKILCGFYVPTEGDIIVNKTHTMANFEDSSWCDNIAVVFQESLILNDTIFSNVSYGTEEPELSNIVEALETVGLLKFVEELPDGLFSVCGDGEGEVKMSGGQRQLLALARAIFRNRSILILDEATSAVDTKSEEQILKKIKQKYKDKIVIFVSHRLSTIRNLDRIGVMADGLMLEEGGHAELISYKSHYRSIFQSQF